MLKEVELFVRRRGPEVFTEVAHCFGLGVTRIINYNVGRFLSEGGICEHHLEVSGWCGAQSVVHRDQAVALGMPDAMKEEVHCADASRCVDDLPTAQSIVTKELLLVG